MNEFLRRSLDAADQSALLNYASDIARSSFQTTAIAPLPSGVTVKVSVGERVAVGIRTDNVVFQVAPVSGHAPARPLSRQIPRLAGRSSSWRRSCQQVERCYRDRDWVVIEGETGSGRSRLGQSVAQFVNPERAVRILRAESFADPQELVSEFDAETDGDDFAVILADVDGVDDDALADLVAIMQARVGRGWVAATVGSDRHTQLVDTLLLPFFTHTVRVPALRHRLEDLDDLVPAILNELTRGADVRLDAHAMRQLSKLQWPGNIAQLRSVLAETVARQRSGVIGADALPAECRSLTRRRLTQLEALERDAIVRSLGENDGNKALAAVALGMSRATIYRKIKDFGIA
jgi:sigma-54 dependent transcriptional regulator, acetoin dehydrogenase operon transcriptional activator AcoR